MSKRKTRPRGTGKRKSKVPAKKARVWFPGKRSRDPQVAAVEQIANEPDPRKRWQMEQALAMSEAVRQVKADDERTARRAHELGLAHPGARIGAGELLDLLQRDIHREDGGGT